MRKGKRTKKGDQPGEGNNNDELEDVGGEEEEEEESTKSMDDVTEDDLQKSLDRLADLAADGDTATRKEELLAKAQSGEELTKAQRDELFQILGGPDSEPEPSAGDELVKSLKENETIAKALDVSEYLDEQHTELCKALSDVADRLEKSDQRQHEFNLVLARATVQMGELVKSMSERLGVIESQPARGPKSRGIPAQPLHKGFGGEPPPGEQLSKSEVLDTLEAMMKDSMEKGSDGASRRGEDLLKAISKYEQLNTISRPLLEEVRAFRNQQHAAGVH